MTRSIGRATLTFRRDLSPTLAIVRVLPEGGTPAFQAGQFITLGLSDPATPEETSWRAYSIASPPSCAEHVELFIRHVMEPMPGCFTTLLWGLPIGATILHRGVSGAFTVEERRPDGSPDPRTLLCVAGGTGVAPFVSQALDLHHRDVPREMILIHGASLVADLAYDEVLRELEAGTASRGPGRFRLRYVPTISRPADPANAGWTGQTGRAESLVDRIEAIAGIELLPSRVAAMACGHDGTVRGVTEALEARGFVTRRNRRPDGSFDIKVESYG